MPELPEVETIRRSLEPCLLGRTIRAVTLHRRDILVAPGDPFGGFSRQRSAQARNAWPRRVGRDDLLLGATVLELRRRGKQLAIIGSEPRGAPRSLVIQLGMSGQLVHRSTGERSGGQSNDHIHARWRFDDGRLLFRDPRRFGTIRVLPTLEALESHWRTLGPDALTIDPDELAAALANADRPIKAALLDQSVLAGVGNIYADESLFASGIRPQRRAASLSRAETARLAAGIRRVLGAAVGAGGSTLRDYVDARGDPGSFQFSHSVYGRAGEPCTRCRRPLAGVVLCQRMTVWCQACQA